jgi:hypothetical protein
MKLAVVLMTIVLANFTPPNEGAPASLSNNNIARQTTKVGEDIAQLVADILDKKLQETGTGQNTKTLYPKDCYDAFKQGHTLSAVYTVQPDYLTPFEVYCNMSNGGGWAVFQRRRDGSVPFDRPWDDYVKGFGDVNGEYWLGLHKIYRLTRWRKFAPQLRIEMQDFSNVQRQAEYSRFFIDGSDEQYKLHVSGFSGTDGVGDSFSYHDGHKFSAPGRDNDVHSSSHCAQTHHAGWWFRSCFASNLNGVYYHTNPVPRWQGLQWDSWTGDYKSLQTTEMKTRPNEEEYLQ